MLAIRITPKMIRSHANPSTIPDYALELIQTAILDLIENDGRPGLYLIKFERIDREAGEKQPG